MPTDYSNFTNPDNRIDPGPTTGGPPPQDDAYWDPIQKRWLGRTSGDGRPMPSTMGARPAGTTWDMNSKQWVPASEGRSDGTTNSAGNFTNGDATTEGRTDVNGFGEGTNVGGSWGGYSGTMVRGPDGKLVLDGSLNGRAADVSRFRGLGAQAAGRGAYQNDYGQANDDAAMGGQVRADQARAAGLARETALRGDAQSQTLGRNMLQAGAQSQQAAAMSTRGGSLAQASALRRQQGGQAAFMQRGNMALEAQRADDMAAGRKQYMDATSAMRAGDATAQGLHQKQAVNQMGNEIDQRGLNQIGSMGYEEMAQNVNKAALDAKLKNDEIAAGIDAAAGLRSSRLADRDLQTNAAYVGAAGAGVAGIGNMMNDSDTEAEKERKRRLSGSDERMKQGVCSLASASAARGNR